MISQHCCGEVEYELAPGHGTRRTAAEVACTSVCHIAESHTTAATPDAPAPLRSAVIQLTRDRLAAADRARGGLWPGALGRLGLGFGAEATAAGSAAKLGVTGRASRAGDVTVGGEDRN
jgi:hypothetical protein